MSESKAQLNKRKTIAVATMAVGAAVAIAIATLVPGVSQIIVPIIGALAAAESVYLGQAYSDVSKSQKFKDAPLEMFDEFAQRIYDERDENGESDLIRSITDDGYIDFYTNDEVEARSQLNS